MKNIGAKRIKEATIENFTSETGIKIRRAIHPLMKMILSISSSKKFIVESYPNLEKNTPYIFASTHLFTEDIAACLSTIDRNAYLLFGTTDQLEHNPRVFLHG